MKTSALSSDLPVIEPSLQRIASRKCLSPDEAEDFTSWARLKLLSERESVVAKFRGRGRLSTYLTTVALNLLRDYRIEKWGKHRSSAAARRLGTAAVRLETLVVRDGFGLGEAIELMRRNEGVRASVEELEEIAAQLPVRSRVRFESDDGVAALPSTERTDERAFRNEAQETAAKVQAALDGALRTLTPEDRLILKLRVENGFSVADVARTLHLEQKPLYRRLERLLGHLRQEMESREVRREDVDAVVAWEGVEVSVDYRLGREIPPLRPSPRKGDT